MEADLGPSPALAWTTSSAPGEAAGKREAPVSPAVGLSTCSLPAGMGWKLGYANPAASGHKAADVGRPLYAECM